LSELDRWIEKLDTSDDRYEHHLLEALWVTWGLNQVDKNLLEQVLTANDFRARAAAVRVLRYTGHQIDNQVELLLTAANDPHGRVRLEAMVAGSWLDKEEGSKIVKAAADAGPMDEWLNAPYKRAIAHLNGENLVEKKKEIRTDWPPLAIRRFDNQNGSKKVKSD